MDLGDSFLLKSFNYEVDLFQNFVLMCISFSANHGCVVSCLAYASAELGDSLGSYGNGTLYCCYALTSFLLAKPLITMLGPKNGLFVGVAGYCIYVAGFLIAVMTSNNNARWYVFMIASAIGGTSGGFLWTAQGRYFARNAKLYADYRQLPIEEVHSTFAGIFAAIYLGFEVVALGIATIVFISTKSQAPFIIFTIYTGIAFTSVLFVWRLDSLKEVGTWNFGFEAISSSVFSAGHMLTTEPRLMLMIPFQFAFGFTLSFIGFYVYGTVINDSSHLGGAYIGLLSSIVGLIGALTAIPAGYVANRFGKSLLMIIGGICFAACGAAFLPHTISEDELGNWRLIVPFLILFGIARGTWVSSYCYVKQILCLVFQFIT